LNNIHYGKRNFGTARIATLTIDQGGFRRAAGVVNINYSLKKGKKTHGFGGGLLVVDI
jgi:hypothetical protein